ncbi:transposase [Gloeothece citriformis]|uniref:transposase n=1 Tax=Gloeothece citriformis TaxID=2546356 RepID=UPI0009FF3F93|nr:transposase [Gloeothece citriformis]
MVEKLCLNAVITVDSFQVTKLLHSELNQGRIEQKKTAESLEVKARVKLFSSLKGGKYVFLKRENDLKESQREKLLIMKEASALIKVMHDMKEELVAKGEQQSACMKREGEKTIPTCIPLPLKKALEIYQ